MEGTTPRNNWVPPSTASPIVSSSRSVRRERSKEIPSTPARRSSAKGTSGAQEWTIVVPSSPATARTSRRADSTTWRSTAR
ncbi:hypothetical protein SMICM304S_12213 [Streptomyces microflavus]